jgi:soluble lytic murein transglycosylase-like protein
MSRIVFANHLQKTIVGLDRPAPVYARPRVWLMLGLLNVSLFFAAAMSWKIDSLWTVLPAAKAYPIPSLSSAALSASTLSNMPPPVAIPAVLRVEPLDPSAQKAAQYISKTYHIAKEASELIAREAFKAGKENHVDPLLVLAIIAVESRFNPISESQAGALGLTQAMPESHPEKVALLQKDQGHILNISDNIKLGTKIIGEYMKRFDNNAVLALQQYNGSLQDTSRSYSKHVLELRAKIGRAVS